MSARLPAIALFTALEARRSRLLLLLAVLGLAAMLLAEFAATLAVTDAQAVRIALLAAILRLAAVFVLSLFVIASMAREVADKALDLVLAEPLPRAVYYAGKGAGYALVATLAAVLYAAFLLPYAPAAQVGLWGLSLACELWLVVGASLLCVMTLTQVPAALCAVAAFYLLARCLAAMQLMAHEPLLATGLLADRIMLRMVDALALALPGLHAYTQTEWLVYHTGSWAALLPVLAQTLIYGVLLVAAGMVDFYRRNL